MFNGVSPVEPNPDFDAKVMEILKSAKGIIMTCEAGGQLIPTPNFAFGKDSRSLKASYRALMAGAQPE